MGEDPRGEQPMNAPSFDDIANRVCERAGIKTLPTAIAMRRAAAYEVDFQALEFEERIGIPPADLHVLALAGVLRNASAEDVRAYLGLGEVISEHTIRRLIEQGLLRDAPPEAPTPEPFYLRDMWGSFFEAFGLNRAAPRRVVERTAAQPVEPVSSDSDKVYVLTDDGERARVEEQRVTRFHVSARLILWADPLHFVRVAGETKGKFSADKRPPAMLPENVPAPFRTLDDVLALSPEAREREIGIKESIRGVQGMLVGNNPGSSWEVREARGEKNDLLVLACFSSSDPGGFLWRAFTGSEATLTACARLNASELLPDTLREGPEQALIEHGASLLWDRLAAVDDAMPIACEREMLIPLLGRSDRPHDTYLPISNDRGDWMIAVRVRAFPASIGAAHSALLSLLERNEAEMRQDLEGALNKIGESLNSYWGGSHWPPPSLEMVLNHLWANKKLRGIVCRHRLREDLVTPYAAEGGMTR